MRYCGPSAEAITVVAIPPVTAVFHRPSGTTHLLVEPAPEILAALADGAIGFDALAERLAPGQRPTDADRAALAERLDELAAAGLVEMVPPDAAR